MSTETVFIAFGSNQGDRQDFCDRAIALMGLLPLSTLTGISSYYETEPVGLTGEPAPLWFYNGVVRVETRLQPEPLLAICQETERSLGRDPEFRNGSRPIDLDLLFYGQRIIETPPTHHSTRPSLSTSIRLSAHGRTRSELGASATTPDRSSHA